MRYIDYKIKVGDKLKMLEKFYFKINIFFLYIWKLNYVK